MPSAPSSYSEYTDGESSCHCQPVALDWDRYGVEGETFDLEDETTSAQSFPMAAQNRDGAMHVDKSKLPPADIGKQLLPFLIGGGSGIVSTTMYVRSLVKDVDHPIVVY